MGNLGIGVMIKMLSGNKESVDAFTSVIGKKIVSLSLGDDDALHFEFADGSKIKIFDDGQTCCESRYMRTDDDLGFFIGSELLGAEIKDGPSIDDGFDEVHDVRFLEVQTSNGVFTMSSHNEHNGYYGGFAIRVAKEQ